MKFGDAFTFVFQDSDWFKKIIIPGLVMLIPVIGQIIILGWSLKIALNVIRNNPQVLPELDFGEDLSRGFKGFVVAFVYSLPMILVYLVFMVLTAVLANAGSNSSGNEMPVLMVLATTCLTMFMVVYSIILGFILPAAYARTVVEDSIGAGLAIGEVFGLVKRAFSAYLLVLVGSLAASFISSLGSIACVIGVLLTAPYAVAVLGHLYGQAYREARDTLPNPAM